MKYGKYFEYLNRSSANFDLSICGFSSDTDTLSLTRELDQGTLNKYRTVQKVYGVKYSNTLSFKIDVMKDPCLSNGTDLFFTRRELNTITSWLTEGQVPTLFHMTNYDNDVTDDEYVDYYGIFTDIEPKYSGSYIIGLTLTFQTNSPFGWSQEKAFTFQSTADTASQQINIKANTAGEPYIYPTLAITGLASGNNTISITNISDRNRVLTVKALKNYTYYIDCDRMTVRDEKLSIMTLNDIGINDLGSVYWFRLVNDDNFIALNGAAKVSIKFKQPIKVGAY